MKLEKTILIALLAVGALFTSCNNGDNPDSVTSLATTVKPSSNVNAIDLFRLDGGALVNTLNLQTTVEAGKRILINYYKASDQTNLNGADFNVYVTGHTWILTKDVIQLTADNEKEVGNDPFFTLHDINISGGYLNVSISVLYNGVPHYINLVDNTILGEQMVADKIKLELRQNAFGFNQGSPLFNIVSFNLEPYKAFAQSAGKTSLVFEIKVNFFDSVTKTFEVTYDMGTSSTQSANLFPVIRPGGNDIFK